MQPAEPMLHPIDPAHPDVQAERNQAAIDLLQSWIEEGDADEQRETGEYLMRVLAEAHIMFG